jgi:hypothetical protein
MYGAVPASLLMEMAYAQGYREQLTFLDEFPPCIYIDRGKLNSVDMGYNWNGFGMISSQDHPAFTKLRERLGEEGYIKIERGWWNGDRVTKPFYLNNMYFDIGEQFSCAPALGVTYDIAYRKNECSPQYGGISDRPFRPEKDTESSEGDTSESSPLFETLPLPL